MRPCIHSAAQVGTGLLHLEAFLSDSLNNVACAYLLFSAKPGRSDSFSAFQGLPNIAATVHKPEDEDSAARQEPSIY